ncbi:hypothetical protein MSPP1_000965 [Malassezia sp. CBS 17886]|nr:hypothetical protein MSPP1_000965 [Malassezia sp. CBS 17886]
MTRHSKQNTALGHFTYAEYQCVCMTWHVYCKECILTDLVTQKAQLADVAKRREDMAQKRAAQEADALEEKHAARIEAFVRSANMVPAGDDEERSGAATRGDGAKRKRGVDDGANGRRDPHAGRESDREAPAIAAFWLPSAAPSVDREQMEALSLAADDRPSTTLCIAGSEKPHKLTTKGLVNIQFGTRTVDGKKQLYCPCCMKEFAQSTNVHAACPDCSVRVERREKDVIVLAREGTGFAGGGTAEAQTKGVAFQG